MGVIKEYQNLDSLTVERLVGNLQTFEANHCSTKKTMDITLMSSKSAKDDSKSDCESDDAKFEAFFFLKSSESCGKTRKTL